MLERTLSRFDHLRAERELDALHWALGRQLHQTDVDLILSDAGLVSGETVRYEHSSGGIVAVLDYKFMFSHDRWPGVAMLTWTRSVYHQIAKALDVPYYVVGYSVDPWVMRVARVHVDGSDWATRPVGQPMGIDEYGRWLWSMRGVHLPDDHVFPGIGQARFRTADEVIDEELRDALVEDEACAEALMHFATRIKAAL